jgi:hypothetical protein
MRMTWLSIRCAICLLLTLTGCVSLSPHRQVIKAPPHDEEYNLPPDDPRFSSPPQYPKGTLNKDNHKHDLDELDDKTPTSNRRLGSNMAAGF